MFYGALTVLSVLFYGVVTVPPVMFYGAVTVLSVLFNGVVTVPPVMFYGAVTILSVMSMGCSNCNNNNGELLYSVILHLNKLNVFYKHHFPTIRYQH